MRPQINSLLAILAAALVAVAAAQRGPIVGGWKPISDLSDPSVKEMANYAVTEYNKRSHASLALKRIVQGESQVVAGTNYRLFLAVANGASPEYVAVVWDKPWQHFRNLTSFEPVSSN